METGIATNKGKTRGASTNNTKHVNTAEIDALIVGAGFGGFTMLNRLRKLGLSCKLYERGASSGGVWYWNCYPGARVDTGSPIYQFFDKELWKDWTFTEAYPSWQEIREYFRYVEKKWDLSKDIEYNKNVNAATYDETRRQWLIECSDDSLVYARWFIPALGFAARRYQPSFEGLSKFSGDVYHTGNWPQYGVNFNNKRVAVIGTGASGVQIIQHVGPKVSHLTVYQRTPNYALPMGQRKLDPEEEKRKKACGEYERTFAQLHSTFSGFDYDFTARSIYDDGPEAREAYFDELFVKGCGFRFWLNTYPEILKDNQPNQLAYQYWRKKVSLRIPDPKKQAILAPEIPPHPWGTKRPSLEQNYYEIMSLPNVQIIDITAYPIEEVTESGIRTRKGLTKHDIIIFATGFDAVTGGLTELNLRGTHGKTIAEHWKYGTRTSMGISMAHFPNMFFLYGPQAPTAFANGPTCVQLQAEWVEQTIKDLIEKGVTQIVAKEGAELDWGRRTQEKWDKSLFPLAKSWYQGANIPGKKVEALNWSGGLPEYKASLENSVANEYQGWIIV